MADPHVALTPFVPTLFGGMETAVRELLGLKPNVRIERRPSRRGGEPSFEFRVILPNDVVIDMQLARPGVLRWPWVSSPYVQLGLGTLPSGVDPRHDPVAGPCVEAIEKLFRREEKLRGEAPSRAMWAAWDEVAAWAEIDDSYYRRVFHGVTGTSANLRLGFQCNQDCHFCWQGRRWPEPPAEMYMTWLHEMGRGGVRQLVITGGEPTLHRSLPDLVRTAREQYRMLTMLQTNAINLRKPSLNQRLEVDRLFVSFHSADADVSDRMTRARGTHRLTVEGILTALRSGRLLQLNCVVERLNVAGLAEHARFIVEHFVEPFPASPVAAVTYSRPQTYYDDALHAESIVPYDEMEPHVLEAVRILRAAGVHTDVTSGSCGLPACLFRSIPEVIDLPAAQHVGMADPAYDGARGACASCTLRSRCQGPGHGYAERFGERGLVPFTELPVLSEGPRPLLPDA